LLTQEITFGYWLRLKRKALDLTREALAERVGWSAATLRKIEAEERRPSVEILERLAEIFNIPPAERSTFIRFGRGRLGLAPDPGVDATPWSKSSAPARSNIPVSPTETIGRLAEITAISENYLTKHIRLVTLLGPPGIGKTRLSQEVGRASISGFPDGVFFVALAPLNDPALIAASIIQALGFLEVKNQSPLERLKDGLREKRLLLILDNVEHLIDAAALLVAELLQDCPDLYILVTSREVLHVPGEWVFPVPALQIPSPAELQAMDTDASAQFTALTLFTQRAQAVYPDFELNTTNLPTVAAICQQLDGLPLAIELLAARIRSMTPEMIMSQLDKHLALHAGGLRTLPPRQQTLYDAISWSYNLLSQPEQQLFAWLSVFNGGFSAQAAEAAFPSPSSTHSVTDLIVSLLDKSLLQRAPDAQNEPRFSMLVTIHQYAAERLQDMGAENTARDRHLDYFIKLAEQVDRESHGPDQAEWFDRVDTEYDNWLAALAWSVSQADPQAAMRLLNALTTAWIVRARYRELGYWSEQILALPGVSSHTLLYAQLLNNMGIRSVHLGDYDDAQAYFDQSQPLWEQLGTEGERGLANANNHRGFIIMILERNVTMPEIYYTQSVEIYKNAGDIHGLALSLLDVSYCANHLDQHDRALALCEQSLDLFRQIGDWWGIALSSQYIGQLYLKQGDYEKAHQFFSRDLVINQRLKSKWGILIALRNLGDLYRFQGDYVRAEQFYTQSLIPCKEIGIKKDLVSILYLLAMVALHRDEYWLARQRFIAYFELARTIFDITCLGDLFSGMAAVAAGTKQYERSARLRGAVQKILDQEDYQWAHEKREFNRLIPMVRQQLGETAFENYAAEGYALTTEEAIAYALAG